jgi:hypothetical protein
MRLCGYEGLAVAVMKQAAHDYCEHLRWMRDHARLGIDCVKELEDMRVSLHRAGQDLREKDIAKERNRLLNQIRHEQDIADLEEWFRSNEFHTLSTVDGEELMNNIRTRLKADPTYRILIGDDF